MRRLLALVPALAMLFMFAPAASANIPAFRQTVPCQGRDTETSTVTAKWDAGSSVDEHLLHQITMDEECLQNGNWAIITFVGSNPQNPTDTRTFWLYVEPGTNRVIGRLGLTKLGVYQRPFYKWNLRVSYGSGHPAIGPNIRCPERPNSDFIVFVRADGSFTHCTP